MSSQVTGATAGGAATDIQAEASPVLRRRNRVELWLFLLPALAFQLVWGWYPLVVTAIISFTDAQPMLPSSFTGLDSYKRVLGDPLVAQAYRVTFAYAGLTIALTFVIPLILAIMLMEVPPRLMRWMMLLWFLPISSISNTILWRYFYSTQYGVLQYIATNFLHLPAQQFLSDPNQVLFWLVFPNILFFGPGVAGLAYMAALQGVPNSYFEAAEVEGASFWRKIWTISIPRLRPVISVWLTLGIINSLQEFAWPQIMTGGEPLGNSRTIVMYLYSFIIEERYSDATALSVLFFLTVMLVVILFRTVFKEDPDA